LGEISQRRVKRLRYSTLVEIKAVVNVIDGTLSLCEETSTIYKAVTAGSTYTANDKEVLVTGDAGDTRWIGVGGKYIYLTDTAGYFTGKDIDTALAEVGRSISMADSPMILTGAEISAGTIGTYSVASLTALVRKTNSLTGILTYVTLAQQLNQAIAAADTTYFVCLDYNGGSPQIVLDTTNPYTRTVAPDRTQIPIGKVMKDGAGLVHFVEGGYNFQDGVRKLHQRAMTLRTLELGTGCAISYFGTNNFKLTAGVVYGGINDIVADAFDSSITKFTPIRSGVGAGVFIEDADANVIDFANYDDGAGSLASVATARYSKFWFYRHADDGHVYVRYGMGSYKLAKAEVSTEPPKPDHLTDFGVLIGWIVVPQVGGSLSAFSVLDNTYSGTAVAEHNALSGIDGGTDGVAPEYYHLTEAELTFAKHQTDFNTTSDAAYTIDRDDVNVPIALTRDDVQTVTIPAISDTCPSQGDRIVILGYGTGVKTITAVAGVLLNGVDGGSLVLDAQYSICELVYYSGDTGSWVVTGNVNFNSLFNRIKIDPNVTSPVIGKVYATYAEATTYIAASGSPSAANPWVIELPAGVLGAPVLGATFRVFDHINIEGQGIATVIDVPVDVNSAEFATFISRCMLTQFDLSARAGVILNIKESFIYVAAGTCDFGKANTLNAVSSLIFNCDLRTSTSPHYNTLNLYGGELFGGNFDNVTLTSVLVEDRTTVGIIVDHDLDVYSSSFVDFTADITVNGTVTGHGSFYDKTASGLTAVTTQAAIDEIKSDFDLSVIATVKDVADAAYTLVSADIFNKINLTRNDVQTISIALYATQAMANNSRIVIQGYGSGVKTIESVAGVTLNGVDNNSFVLDAQYSSCELACYATNTWIITGGVN